MQYRNNFIIWLVIITLFAVVFNRGGIPLLSHMILTAGVFLIALTAVIHNSHEQRRENKIQFLLTLLFGLFFAQFLLSFLPSIAINYGVSEFFLLANALIIFLVFQRIEFTEMQRKHLVNGILAVAIASTLVGIYYYLHLPFNRFTGTFTNPAEGYNGFPNAYANFLLFILPIAIYQLIRVKRRGEITVFAAVLILLLSGFILSFSRGAWVSLGVVIALFAAGAVIKNRTAIVTTIRESFVPNAIKIVIIIIITAALTATLNYGRSKNYQINTFTEKISLTADERTASTSERLEFWQGSFQIISDYPQGTGPGSFKFIYPRYQKTFGAISDHPHNVFLKIGVENGIFAATIFFLLLALSIFIGFKSGLYYSPFLWGAIGGIMHNIVDFNLNFASNTLLLWLFLGLITAEIHVVHKGVFQKISQRRILIAGFVFIAILFGISAHETYYNKIFRDGRQLLQVQKYEEAVPLLKKAQNVWWERDLPLSLAEAYVGVDDIQNARSTLEQTFQKNIQNATYVNYYAELAERFRSKGRSRPPLTTESFQQALRLDPANNLRYHYNVARTGDSDSENLENLLDRYTDQLARNEHLTILTDNPEYAVKLYDLLIQKTEDTAEKRRLEEKKRLLQQIWFDELAKFDVKY